MNKRLATPYIRTEMCISQIMFIACSLQSKATVFWCRPSCLLLLTMYFKCFPYIAKVRFRRRAVLRRFPLPEYQSWPSIQVTSPVRNSNSTSTQRTNYNPRSSVNHGQLMPWQHTKVALQRRPASSPSAMQIESFSALTGRRRKRPLFRLQVNHHHIRRKFVTTTKYRFLVTTRILGEDNVAATVYANITREDALSRMKSID